MMENGGYKRKSSDETAAVASSSGRKRTLRSIASSILRIASIADSTAISGLNSLDENGGLQSSELFSAAL